MITYCATDIGKRPNNEDMMSIAKKNQELLMIVCDGMGGHNSGEVASKMVTDTLKNSFLGHSHFQNVKEAKQWMSDTIIEAHLKTKRYAYTNEAHAGMGTTIVCALIYDHHLFVCSIGDSRCYYVTKEKITCLTIDDTFVNELVKSGVISAEQAKYHEKKNILMKAVGVSDNIDPVVESYDLKEGYILLCSDGLYNGITERQMKEILYTKDELSKKGEAMIMLANRQGGKDNVTVAIAKIERGDLL